MKAAPQELQQIGLDPHAFVYSDKKSWRGPCPQCGGHRRFVIFTDKEWPLWNGFCDQCGMVIKAWQRVRFQYDPQKAAAMEAEQARQDAERAEYRRKKLAEFASFELLAEMQERLTREDIDWWESQGVMQDIQKYLRIGRTPDKAYYNDDRVLVHSPAYTIPWFGKDFEFKTMQYRLLNDDTRRYIFEDGLGGGMHYYMTEPDQPIKDKVIICEGAKKAIVTWFWLSEGFTVLAASSANTFDAALEATKNCGLRYVLFDPDVKPHFRNKAIATNPKTTHEVRLPFKVDDGWIKYGLDRNQFMKILESAL